MLANLVGSRQRILRSVNGEDGHAVPEALVILWPMLPRQLNDTVENVFENPPVHLLSSLGDGSSAGRLSVGPHVTSTGHLEEQPTFDVDAFCVPANEMKNENQQPSEGQLALACEMLRILFWMRAYAAGKESENIFKKSSGLARKFHARPVP